MYTHYTQKYDCPLATRAKVIAKWNRELLYEAFLAMDSDVARNTFLELKRANCHLGIREYAWCLAAQIVLRAGQSPRRPCFGGQDIDLTPFSAARATAHAQKRGGV